MTKHQSFEYEKYASYVISGVTSQPASSVMQYTATGAFTLNLSSISSKLASYHRGGSTGLNRLMLVKKTVAEVDTIKL